MTRVVAANAVRTGPLVSAGAVIGFGMGGFIDGIVLHQILQWHQMISNILPPDTLANKQVNTFWDGIFHAATWTATAIGIALLWRALRRRDVIASPLMMWGALLLGWGTFNVMDSAFNHYIFGLHNVHEWIANPMMSNHIFLAVSIGLIVIGWSLVQSAKRTSKAAENL